ncbi:MAG TPA: type II toxin-antitoxin system RelE/ParE family toxin [Xanthobacteraceae bacterium]|jgi:toxin ParE1/3/4
MRFEVWLTADAERDIEDIHRYIAEHGGRARADRVLRSIEQTCLGLATLPERGNIPKELLLLGIREYREAHCRPYRIIYRVMQRRVVVYCGLDGRRDMQTLLQHRLLLR